MSIISTLIYNKNRQIKASIFLCAKFYVIYYFFICILRTIVGNGNQYLGTSFADKTLRAYIKVGILGVAVFIGLLLFIKIAGEKGKEYLNLVLGIFSSLCLLHTVMIDLPRMKITMTLGLLALIISAFLILLKIKYKMVWLSKRESNIKVRLAEISVTILLFICLFLITGPTELYIYNAGNFVFSFTDFFPYMLLYAIALILAAAILISDCLPDILFTFTKYSIFLYCLCSYIQQMFLNGNMSKMEGFAQEWSPLYVIGNLFVWIILIGLILLVLLKSEKRNLIIKYTSAFIVGVQLITFLTLLLTNNVMNLRNQQLIEDEEFHLSPDENIVVFILDAYDTQMLDKVLEEDASFLKPLHGFTYYKNMTSRYTATDGSLPYLLTGQIAEEENDSTDIYEKSTFLKDIRESGYNINILTEANYVAPFDQNIVNNMTDDFYCVLDYEKTVSQMSKCVRYRSAPFILKPYYHYENYDLTNVIYDTNIYLFGTDAAFYNNLCENGICIDPNIEHAMKIYHLYGAHSPYYLTEEATLDYNSNPIAQWKGCLNIVYRYLEQLDENGLYDNTSVIIMADHGLNRTQRMAMDARNISVSDKSNPIFFIKRNNQHQEQLVISQQEVSHDDFFATIMKLIDENNEKYGEALWEK